jgi:hypothetical protein
MDPSGFGQPVVVEPLGFDQTAGLWMKPLGFDKAAEFE